MKIRYHAWMTRRFNGEAFSDVEHCVYAGMAISLMVIVLGVSYFAFIHRSAGMALILAATYAAAWCVMSQTPSGPNK